MPRLIDADVLMPNAKYKGKYDTVNAYDIVNCPTVDAEPVRHGRWERVAEQPYFRKHYHTLCCSECHSEGYAKWKYCPNCGSKMEEVEDADK